VELIEPKYRHQLYTLRYRSWHLYSMLFRCSGALTLSRSNLGLAYALANHWVFTGKPSNGAMRISRRMVGRPRREIARFLGFPDRKAAVRILGKVRGRDLNIERLLWLRRALHEPKMLRILSHVDRIEVGVLEAFADEAAPAACSGSLVREMCEMTALRGEWFGQEVHGLLSYARELDEPIPRLVKAKQVNRLFHEFFTRSMAPQRPTDLDLGAPPVRGIPGQIEPLRTLVGLYDEGVEQRNCLTRLGARREGRLGRQYFYRLLEPQRCTISLRRCSEAGAATPWAVHDFKSADNGEPNEGAKQAVRDWLSGAKITVDMALLDRRPSDDLPEPFDGALIPL